MSRKDGNVVQYPLVRSDGAKCIRGYNGRMYIGLIDETRWTYTIVELDVDGTKNILYKRKIDDIPMSTSSSKQITVITHVNNDGEEFSLFISIACAPVTLICTVMETERISMPARMR